MGKLTDDILKWTLDIDGNPARKELTEVSNSTNKLERDNRALATEMAKLEAHGKKGSEEWKKYEAQIKANDTAISANKKRMEELRKEVGLNNLSARELRKEMSNLKRQMDGMDPNSKQWAAANAQFTAMRSRLTQVQGGMAGVTGVFGAFKSLLPVIGITAIVAGFKSLVTNIINVRKEFEKYEAVLTNTLGSNRAARTEMQMLQKFATETPFALTELTGAFVKLTNYGLKPSKEEMRKYGDLASSVGKGFDQLVEAVADATTFEFERLKEFGIKARKEGDKISFTFKEQTTVVDANSQSIKNYILGLGDLKGVQGSMAAIANTLGGKISNLGDSWDGLMNTMGAGSSGVMVTVITWLTNFVNMLDGAFKSIKQIKDSVRDQAITNGMNNAIQEIDVMTKSLEKNGMSHQAAQKRAFELYRSSMNETVMNLRKDYETATGDQKAELGKRIVLMKGEYDAVKGHYKAIDDMKKKQDDDKFKKNNSDEAKKKASDAAIKQLDEANNKRIAAIAASYEREAWTEDRYRSEQLSAELAYLTMKKALLEKYGQDVTSVDAAINQKRTEMQKSINDALASADKDLFDQIAADAKVVDQAVDESIKIADAAVDQIDQQKDREKEILEQRQQNYLDFAVSIGQGFGQLMNDSEATFGDYLANTLEMALEAFHQFFLIEKYKTIIANAGKGPLGWIKGAAQVAAMEVAYQAAKGLITKTFSSKGKQSGGFSSTDGSDSTPDGVYHKNEFIASAPAVRNPTVRPILNIIDMAQRQGKIATLNLPAVMASVGMASKQSGGFAGTSNQSFNSSAPQGTTLDPATANRLITAIDRLAKKELILHLREVKNGLDNIADIDENSGL